eukprot:4491569-Lingulodinium_polyedra.AAC.1
MPLQTLFNIMIALEKGDGPERLIGLLAVCNRVFFKARKQPLDLRCRQRARFWDLAVRKSSALRAAVLR